jgi:hypothetical protein
MDVEDVLKYFSIIFKLSEIVKPVSIYEWNMP